MEPVRFETMEKARAAIADLFELHKSILQSYAEDVKVPSPDVFGAPGYAPNLDALISRDQKRWQDTFNQDPWKGLPYNSGKVSFDVGDKQYGVDLNKKELGIYRSIKARRKLLRIIPFTIERRETVEKVA